MCKYFCGVVNTLKPPTVSEHDLGVTLSVVMVAVSGVGERGLEGAGWVQLMGKANGQVSLPARGDQITDNPIKDQATPLYPHRLRDREQHLLVGI